MSSHAIIARRISPNKIQYGNVINDGYLDYLGKVLFLHYNSPEKVEQLFSLGQLETLGAPGTETNKALMDSNTGTFCTKLLDGYHPHETCKSEQEIEPKIFFSDYYYLYEPDNHWYYIKPAIEMQKISLDYILARMFFFQKHPEARPKISDIDNTETCVHYEMDMTFLKEILFSYPKKDPEYKKKLKSYDFDTNKAFTRFGEEDFPLDEFYETYGELMNYFDLWSIYEVADPSKPISKVHLCKASEKHIETYLWGV